MQIECRNLNYSYPGSETAVIDNLSFELDESGFHAVFGPSGVGKTSLAKVIAGMIPGFSGEILTEQINTTLYSYNLERLPGWSSVGKHLGKVTPVGKEDLRESLVSIFELENILDSRFSMLSMGQQNRINLIRYLLQDFDLLIMDESLANVDEQLREEIILAIKELFSDKMFLYISHNLMEVSKFCRQILIYGKASSSGGSFMIKGLDYRQGYGLDKKMLDSVMLEVMNAF